MLDCILVGIKVSSHSEYKVKNGLSCTKQFKSLGQDGTCYHIVFDEWTDIRMYYMLCASSLPKYTSGRKDFILEPRLEERQQVFSSLQGGRGDKQFLKRLRGEQMFLTYVSSFRSPPYGNK